MARFVVRRLIGMVVVLFAVSMAHDVLVVATPEPTSLTDAYATIKVLATQQDRRQVRLIINQANRPGEGKLICGQLQQVLQRFVGPQPISSKFTYMDLICMNFLSEWFTQFRR